VQETTRNTCSIGIRVVGDLDALDDHCKRPAGLPSQMSQQMSRDILPAVKNCRVRLGCVALPCGTSHFRS
jgi:hypothetical protein